MAGQISEGAGNYTEALRLYSLAIQANPSYQEALARRGFVNYELKRFPECQTDFSAALTIDEQPGSGYFYRPNRTDNITWRHAMTRCIFEMGDYSRAVEEYSREIRRAEDHLNSYTLRSNTVPSAISKHLGLIATLKAERKRALQQQSEMGGR